MNAMTRKTTRTLLRIAAIGLLVVALAGGSADAGSKVGAKKLKEVVVRTATTNVDAGKYGFVTVSCLADERGLSAGGHDSLLLNVSPIAVLQISTLLKPAINPTQAVVAGRNTSASDTKLTGWIECLHK